MSERCPVCGQALPKGMNAAQMHRRLEKIGAVAAERETNKLRRELGREYRTQLTEKAEKIRKDAARKAEESSRQRVKSLERSLDASERASQRQAEKAAKDAAREATREAAKVSRKEVDFVNERAAKERAQHAADTGRLKAQVDVLSLKLERQTSEQMGDVAEADAFEGLRRAFPHDDIQRVGRGVRGADILHKVIVEGTDTVDSLKGTLYGSLVPLSLKTIPEGQARLLIYFSRRAR